MQFLSKIIAISLLLTLLSCSNYGSTATVDFKVYNDEISVAKSQNANWVGTPVSIVKNLFPSETKPEGNRNYKIEEDKVNSNLSEIMVIDEGIIDDEVTGIKRDLVFKKNGGQWQIIKMSIRFKR